MVFEWDPWKSEANPIATGEGLVRRIISARRSNRRERKTYAEAIEG